MIYYCHYCYDFRPRKGTEIISSHDEDDDEDEEDSPTSRLTTTLKQKQKQKAKSNRQTQKTPFSNLISISHGSKNKQERLLWDC